MILKTVILPVVTLAVSVAGKAGTGRIVVPPLPRLSLLHRTMADLSSVETADVQGTTALSAICPESGTRHPLSTKGLRHLLP